MNDNILGFVFIMGVIIVLTVSVGAWYNDKAERRDLKERREKEKRDRDSGALPHGYVSHGKRRKREVSDG